MPNKIKLRRSYTAGAVPLTSDLETNEVCINYADNKLFVRTPSNTIQSITLGGSGGSGEDALLRALFVPPAPTSLTATAGNAQVSLSWTAPTVLSVTPITDYVVQFSSNSGSTWTTFSDGTSTTASATVTGLTNGTAYVFRVAAVNGAGTGAYSSATSSVTPSDGIYRAIPTMTGATAPSGVASGENLAYPAWYAFDGNDNTFTWSDNPPQVVVYDFGSDLKSLISGYTIKSSDQWGGRANNWTFLGSNDGTTFVLLDTRTGQKASWGGSGSGSETRTYYLASPANYRAYKWVFTLEGADQGPAIIAAQLLQ